MDAEEALRQAALYEEARKKHQEALERALANAEDEEELQEGQEDDEARQRLLEKTFASYLQAMKLPASQGPATSDEIQASLSRTEEQLKSAASSTACLICLETIRTESPVWECRHCYKLLHLSCIAAWCRSAPAKASPLSPDAFPAAAEKAPWLCPNCRWEYTRAEVPTKYTCFCGQVDNPPVDRWLVPHSCGQTCSRDLGCGHECKLLCHAGPCPPCPISVEVRCWCGKQAQRARCGQGRPSCGKPCLRQLDCGAHKCLAKCHEGECAPCGRSSERGCRCGRVKGERPCGERDFQCGEPCGRPLSCGHHSCAEVCHAGACPPCPLSQPRKCPCGKTEIRLPCSQPTPACKDTCDKFLACGRHKCSNKCHHGPCGTCRQMVNKKCRCGGEVKMLPCSQELTCERKCQADRSCGRHACRRRCCTGEHAVCEEVCGRKLNCGTHKCEATCHAGPCFPCPRTVTIECACGTASVTVPCGRERVTPIPRCKRYCQNPPYCRHPYRKPHWCHYGPCPPCKQQCAQPLPGCQHVCPAMCHDPQPPPPPPPDPRAPPKRKPTLRGPEPPPPPEARPPPEPCPPCAAPMVRQCLGEHETRAIPCSMPPFRCGRTCDNLLSCGNHRCELPCHVVAIPRSPEDFEGVGCEGLAAAIEARIEAQRAAAPPAGSAGAGEAGSGEGGAAEEYEFVDESCEFCERPCEKPRPCPHPCPLQCHPGECPRCDQAVPLKCWCGKRKMGVPCHRHREATPEELETMRSCGHPCGKKLACGHVCERGCHSGECAAAGARCVAPWPPSAAAPALLACDEARPPAALGLGPRGADGRAGVQACAKAKAEAEAARARKEEERRRAEEAAAEAKAAAAAAAAGGDKRERKRKKRREEAGPSLWERLDVRGRLERHGTRFLGGALLALFLAWAAFLYLTLNAPAPEAAAPRPRATPRRPARLPAPPALRRPARAPRAPAARRPLALALLPRPAVVKDVHSMIGSIEPREIVPLANAAAVP
eukprot:tig00000865_g5087.t1